MRKKNKERKNSKEKEQLLNIDPILLEKSVSEASDDDELYAHHKDETSLTTKLDQIKRGTSKRQRMKKQKIKQIRSFSDFSKWYLQNPMAHFRAIYFFICFLLSFIFMIYWFMDTDSCYMLCGIVGLSMSGYALRSFRLSISLKKEIDKYKSLNLKLKKENLQFEANVNRAQKAHELLVKTKRRLTIANNSNLDNIQKFEEIETNMKILGEKAIKGMNKAHGLATHIRRKWRAEFLANERDMLGAVYKRYERKHRSRGSLAGMTANDFKLFQAMLPKRYTQRFNRMGTFKTLAGNESLMDFKGFANLLDSYAVMEVDNVDIPIFEMSPSNSIMSNMTDITDIPIFDALSPASSTSGIIARHQQIVPSPTRDIPIFNVPITPRRPSHSRQQGQTLVPLSPGSLNPNLAEFNQLQLTDL